MDVRIYMNIVYGCQNLFKVCFGFKVLCCTPVTKTKADAQIESALWRTNVVKVPSLKLCLSIQTHFVQNQGDWSLERKREFFIFNSISILCRSRVIGQWREKELDKVLVSVSE